MRLVILGPQGSGKGTQAKLLIEKFGLAYFAMGDALRAEVASGSDIGRQIASILERGDLVPNDVTERLIEKFVKSNDAFIVDGYPRNMGQAAFFDGVTDIDAVLVLEIGDDTAVRRLLSRGRSDDNEETIRNRLGIYHEKTKEVIGHYGDKVIRIDGEGTIEEVQSAILAKLK